MRLSDTNESRARLHTRLTYRPEVDGIRAIAVASVVIYHGQFVLGGKTVLPGGFLGVDVFFVISGFLITSLIKMEFFESGDFSYSNFYERRARRLLPALFLTMAATIPLAWVLLLPSSFVDFAKSLLASIFFGSNHYWHIALQEYGAESSLRRPLLHTWSLAVEEQFYLLFPAALLLLLKRFSSLTVPMIVIMALASFALANTLNREHQEFAFYLLPTRFWELAAGALLALTADRFNPSSVAKMWLPSVGLTMVLVSMCIMSLDYGHPGAATVLPVVGTMLMLNYCDGSDPAGRLLTSRPFIALGLISYSLYLWHYPILAFLRIHYSEPPLAAVIACISIAIILAAASYRWLEQPFRDRSRVKPMHFWSVILIWLGALSGFGLWAIASDGYKERFPELIALYGKNEFDNRLLNREANSLWKQLAHDDGFTDARGLAGVGPSEHESHKLWFSEDSEGEKALVIGNSHSRDLFNGLHQQKSRFPGLEFARFELHNRLKEEELELLFSAPNYGAADYVIISFRLRAYTFEKLPEVLARMQADGKKLVLVSSYHGFNDIDSLTPFDWYIRQPENRGGLSHKDLNQIYFENQHTKNQKVLNNRLKRLAKEYGATYLDKSKVVCRPRRRECFGITPDGYKTYYDKDHWTLRGASFFGKRIADTNWLKIFETPTVTRDEEPATEH